MTLKSTTDSESSHYSTTDTEFITMHMIGHFLFYMVSEISTASIHVRIRITMRILTEQFLYGKALCSHLKDIQKCSIVW